MRNYDIAEWAAALARSGFAMEGLVVRPLRMEFPDWVARTRTAPGHVEAIRSLQRGAPASLREHFAIGADGSFDLTVASFTLRAA